jgi:hypothetical protein
MTTAITVDANGIGRAAGPMFAFDRAATLALTGLAAAYNGLPVTAYLSTQDGHTALAAHAHGSPAAGAVSVTFDLDTAACLTLFSAGLECATPVRLRLIVTATDEVIADAVVSMHPGPKVTP